MEFIINEQFSQVDALDKPSYYEIRINVYIVELVVAVYLGQRFQKRYIDTGKRSRLSG